MKDLRQTVDDVAARLSPSTRPDPQGQLLPQGSKLTNWFLASLSSRGMDTLPTGNAVDPTRAPLPFGGQHATRLGKLFRKFGDTPADRFFREAITQHRNGERT